MGCIRIYYAITSDLNYIDTSKKLFPSRMRDVGYLIARRGENGMYTHLLRQTNAHHFRIKEKDS